MGIKATVSRSVAELLDLLLAGAQVVVSSKLGDDGGLHVSLSIHDFGADVQKRFQTLLRSDHVRVALLCRDSPHDLVVLERSVPSHSVGHSEEVGFVLAAVKTVQPLDLALDQVVVNVLLGLANLLESPLQLVHDLDVTHFDGLALISDLLVEGLQLARLSCCADRVAGVVELAGLGDSEVEADFSVALEVVMLDFVAHETQNLVLDFIVVDKRFLAHRDSLWHPDLPLYLVWNSIN